MRSHPLTGEATIPGDSGLRLVEVVDELGVDKQVESNQDRQFADGQDLNELKNLHIDILRRLAMKG